MGFRSLWQGLGKSTSKTDTTSPSKKGTPKKLNSPSNPKKKGGVDYEYVNKKLGVNGDELFGSDYTGRASSAYVFEFYNLFQTLFEKQKEIGEMRVVLPSFFVIYTKILYSIF